MSKSQAGIVSQPARNVRAKSGLNRSILDQSWYEMRRQLEYKQRWRTIQRGAYCGHTAKEYRQSQSTLVCQVYGYTANASVNGARNILAVGHAVIRVSARSSSTPKCVLGLSTSWPVFCSHRLLKAGAGINGIYLTT